MKHGLFPLAMALLALPLFSRSARAVDLAAFKPISTIFYADCTVIIRGRTVYDSKDCKITQLVDQPDWISINAGSEDGWLVGFIPESADGRLFSLGVTENRRTIAADMSSAVVKTVSNENFDHVPRNGLCWANSVVNVCIRPYAPPPWPKGP